MDTVHIILLVYLFVGIASATQYAIRSEQKVEDLCDFFGFLVVCVFRPMGYILDVLGWLNPFYWLNRAIDKKKERR